jgi:hypothetical protein
VSGVDRDERADASSEVERLGTELQVALDALAEAEAGRAAAEGRLRLAYVDLAAWDAQHEETARAVAELELRVASTREQLEAVLSSRSWRLVQGALTPYRWARGRQP